MNTETIENRVEDLAANPVLYVNEKDRDDLLAFAKELTALGEAKPDESVGEK